MTNRIRLAALALAAALAISGNTTAHADNHGLAPGEQVVSAKYRQYLRGLTDKQLRGHMQHLQTQFKQTNRPGLRDQLSAVRKERARRLAKGVKSPSAAKLSKNELRARKILQTAVAAKSLRTPALEGRVAQTRKLLKGIGLRDTTRTKLSTLLSGDRTELHRRQKAARPASKSERQAIQLLKGPQASTLRTPALRERVQTARRLLATGKLSARTQTRLKQLAAADRTALRAREASQQVGAAEKRARRHIDNAVTSNRLRAPALRERIRKSDELLQLKGLRPATRQELRQLVQADRNALNKAGQQSAESNAERRAINLLEASVSPDKLNGLTLRERIRDTRSLLREPDISRRTRLRLQARLDRDLAELRSRRAGQAGSADADRLARALLNDSRAPLDLSDRRLQRRLRETRDILQDPQLSRGYSRELRSRLRADRRELRRRVNARRNDGATIGVIIGSGAGVAALLNDRRPSHALRTKQLSHRVRHAQSVLRGGALSNYDRSVLTDMLVSDRRELRQRLRSRRDRRRAELERQRRNNDINIVIAPQIEFAPRDDVAAAEADDDVIERQLIAPPTREIDRRYTMDEFRRRPDLRRYMPAVEVDSIRFGSNEHFLREEEIDELERIGAIIERVVAANPGEVFLIEGHTDAVGSEGYNLALSTKRADAVRNALLEFFVVKPENLATIGYGEQFLKIPTQEDEEENRRVSVRRITPLLASR